MTFQPYPTRSGFIVIGVAVLLAFLAAYVISLLLRQESFPNIFWLAIWLFLNLILLGTAIYWALIIFKLNYHLNRNGIVIQWGLARYLIPFDKIETITPGKNLTTPLTFKGLKLFELHLGWGDSPELGTLKFHTTTTLSESLLVVTTDQAYVISPYPPHQFLKAWQARYPLGPTQQWPLGLQRSWPFNTSLFRDRFVWWLLGAAFFVYLAFMGHLSLLSSDLPPQLFPPFDEISQFVDLTGQTNSLTFPLVGVIILGFNLLLGATIYYYEKMAAYLLWGGTIAVLLSLWMTLIAAIA